MKMKLKMKMMISTKMRSKIMRSKMTRNNIDNVKFLKIQNFKKSKIISISLK
jgi:hypothetical protein